MHTNDSSRMRSHVVQVEVSPEQEAFHRSPRLTCVPCEERDRLNRIYHEAIAKIHGSGKTVSDMTSAKWREATKDTRAACRAALADLKRHTKEHGC
jgi:hypothetical protein